MKRAPGRTRGITLVEVVIALAVVITVSAAILSALVYATAAGNVLARKQSALLACENVVNSLRTDTPGEALTLLYGDGVDTQRIDDLYTAAANGDAVARESFVLSFGDGSVSDLLADGCDFYVSFELEAKDGAVFLHMLRAAVREDGTYVDSYALDLPIRICTVEVIADE